ncbi:SubName: Full=Uncharacterized protein {ECO:0000313/EMBL:CCA70465.1} [Serendipita indica DSM 11827]|nr:SubName: Full=Uncharacterized protein {ECO:0000313/EMBL:CCA70465.1} [Serendipita indica DSM 11827]
MSRTVPRCYLTPILVASRIVAAISSWLPILQSISNTVGDSKIADHDESLRITGNIIQCLSILQGVSLLHKPSKDFLCRRWCLELLLDLLVLSKYLNPSKDAPKSSDGPVPTCLASAVLDTLLCVLVDAPAVLRLFEELNGLEVLVRTLKRPGVTQETRMKCLEFLYFYLLPEEDPLSVEGQQAIDLSASQGSQTASDTSDDEFAPNPKVAELRLLRNDIDFTPATPIKQKKRPVIGGVPTPNLSSKHRHGTHDDGSFSNPLSRDHGHARGTSEVTLVPSSSSGSLIESGDDTPRTPIKLLRAHRSGASKESDSEGSLDRVQTPQRRHLREASYADNTLVNNPFDERTPKPARQKMPFPSSLPPTNVTRKGEKMLLTTDEKTQLLAKHLGNVHALVAGMKHTGIWGLH